jgi:sulfopropanediol 3-dehydrogenase
VARHLKHAEAVPRAATDEIRATVSEILLAVEREGERAVRRYSERFDGWSPPSFRVSAGEIAAAEAAVGDELARHVAFAQEQVRRFAEAQRATLTDFETETLPGVRLGQRHVPVGAVGSYSPGGRYPMLASSIMTVVTARVAGVRRVVAAAPPRAGTGGIHPPQLYAMHTSGADEILCLGGVQALAALAFGIDGLEPVDMLVGPGNAYVAEAKRQLFGTVGIDLLAGPTEIAIVADETADPELVAADLLGQAEHGPTSAAVLITLSEPLGTAVLEEVERQLASLPSADVAGPAWRDHGAVVLVEDREEAARVADEVASEHLEIHAADPDWFLDRLANYGTLFLGPHSTVAYSDKAIGTNHVLPTAGAARYTGGLWVGRFLKTLTYQRVAEDAAPLVAPPTIAISEAERFPGHALTARLRLERAGGAPPARRRPGSTTPGGSPQA